MTSEPAIKVDDELFGPDRQDSMGLLNEINRRQAQDYLKRLQQYWNEHVDS
jgi:hypothetical protein